MSLALPEIDDLPTDLRESARSARREATKQEEGPPPGRAQHVTEEDLEATRHRIMTGLPMAPLPGWRW